MAMEQLEEDHMVLKNSRQSRCYIVPQNPFSVSLSPVLTHIVYDQLPTSLEPEEVGGSKQQITSIGNMRNLFGFLFME